jgi:2',3'-cyclic-nucleotide 2'-phosphodiesterase (5'-nucleotidase family)
VKLLAMQGLVATAVGEADLAIGLDMLEAVAKEAPFAVLAANLIAKDGRRPFQSSLVHKLGSLQVGLIGLVSPHVGVERTPAPVKVESPAKRLKQVLAAFDPRPDRVVLLAHMSPKEALDLLEQVPGIDLAVLGHPMGHKTPAAVVGKSLLVGTDIRGRELGEVVLPAGRTLAVSDHHLVPLTPAIGVDATVAHEVAQTMGAMR